MTHDVAGSTLAAEFCGEDLVRVFGQVRAGLKRGEVQQLSPAFYRAARFRVSTGQTAQDTHLFREPRY